MTDEPRNGSPSTVREVGIEVAHLRDDFVELRTGLRDDFVELRTELRSYIAVHADAHKILEAEVRTTTDWRKERQVYEGLIKWLVGSNLAVLVGVVIAVLAFLR